MRLVKIRAKTDAEIPACTEMNGAQKFGFFIVALPVVLDADTRAIGQTEGRVP